MFALQTQREDLEKVKKRLHAEEEGDLVSLEPQFSTGRDFAIFGNVLRHFLLLRLRVRERRNC